MKIKFSNRLNEQITRTIMIGTKVVGVRLDSVEIQSKEELNQLLSPEGIQWARHNLNFRPLSNLVSIQDNLTDNRRESNWGSDWVDDGT